MQNTHIFLPIYSYDFLKVWDGLSPGETKISELTGSTIPSPVASYGNTMFLNFLSDDSERKAGFKLQYYVGRNNFTVSFISTFLELLLGVRINLSFAI